MEPEIPAAARRSRPQAAPPRRTALMRYVGVIAILLTGFHIFATFLWIAPNTPLRDLVGRDTLRSYMIPMYGQSWSVFAPDPINGNFDFRVRASVAGADGTTTETEWVNAVDVELTMQQHHFFPPRAYTLALSSASKLKTEWDKLGAEGQAVVAKGYFKGEDWHERMEEALRAVADDTVVTNYLKAETVANSYATQVAFALWGKNATTVQFEITRQNILPFDRRHEVDPEPMPIQKVVTGWRGSLVQPGQSTERFAEIFVPLEKKVRSER